MHDSQLEDRLRTVLRAEGDALPVTITPEELERRLAMRRRERAGRWVGLFAAGLAVVAIGSLVVMSGGWFGEAGVGPPAGPSVTQTPTPAPTSGPTTAELTCSTIEPDEADQPPSVVLGAWPGDSIPYFGALGAYKFGDRQDGEEGSWTSVDPKRLDPIPGGPPTERLEALASDSGACLASLIAEAVPFGEVGASVVTLAALTTGPTQVIAFALPPAGEWLVRVHADFATVSGAEAWSETFFRVDARNPAASLGPVLSRLPILATPPATIFVDAHSDKLEPADPTGRTEETIVGEVLPRSQYLVDVVCLGLAPVRWSIGHEGQFGFLAAGDQPCDGTTSTQSVEQGTPPAALDVVVQGDPATAWRIRVATIADEPSFIPPPLLMRVTSDADGAAGAAEAFGRCISTPDTSEPCGGEWFVLDGARALLAPVGSSVTVALEDGWEITEARLTAAVTDQVRAHPLPPEYSVGFVETGGSEVTVPVELGRGSWIVRVALNATRDGETFGAHYDFPLYIGE